MDPITLSAIAGGGSSAAGLLGTIWQTGQSRDMMNDQMAFQAQMSNTAHQREVEDLRAAGLNPILSATGGSGASSPTGGMGSVENPGQSVTQGISTALGLQAQANQNKSVEKDIEAKDAQIKNVDADTANKWLNGPLLKNQTVSTGLDIKAKELANKLATQTFGDMVKKARLEGRTAIENTYEGIRNTTGTTAKSYLDLGSSLKEFLSDMFSRGPGVQRDTTPTNPYME